MKRMFYIDNDYYGTDKYKLRKEYEGFCLYQRVCPSGYFEHQSYLVTNGDKVVVSESYNNLCFDEMLDMIDRYNEENKFGYNMISKMDKTNEKVIHYIHPSGEMR